MGVDEAFIKATLNFGGTVQAAWQTLSQNGFVDGAEVTAIAEEGPPPRLDSSSGTA